MRIIAGTKRSLPLKALEGDTTRPTLDRYKETLFNVIQSEVPGSLFLDLYAGSGSIGIEALSRGAKRAVFVEQDVNAVKIIVENLRFTKLENDADVIRSDVNSFISGLKCVNFDVIYIDPPCNKGLERKSLERLAGKEFINPDKIIIVEADINTDFSYVNDLGFVIYKTKNYKSNKHVFIKKKQPVVFDSIND